MSEEEDSVPAAVASDAVPTETAAPVGPSPDEEAAFLAEQGQSFNGTLTPGLPAVPDASAVETPLPPMEDLVQRIPAEARELIEELFRARFVTVKRLSEAALKKN